RAGIRSGDWIVAVDGEDVVGQPLDKVVKRMRGAAGTKLKIGVLRETKGASKRAPAPVDASDAGVSEAGAPERSGQTLTFELTREVIHVAAVTSKLLDGNVAYF